MNPLQEHPHLFANGKFKHNSDHGIRTIVGIEDVGDFKKFIFERGTWSVVENCTLIARPIEDMTDEEIRNINNDYPPHILRTSWEYQTEIGNLSFSTAREFLAIGVYPGPQSHFKDGTVIDSRTI